MTNALAASDTPIRAIFGGATQSAFTTVDLAVNGDFPSVPATGTQK